jgi:hypothetical protein
MRTEHEVVGETADVADAPAANASINTISEVDIPGLSVKSSVVGIVILAISFAFFGAYVKYVYTLNDSGNDLPAEVTVQNLPPPASSNGPGPASPVPTKPRQ